jgi:hypothetical protein
VRTPRKVRLRTRGLWPIRYVRFAFVGFLLEESWSERVEGRLSGVLERGLRWSFTFEGSPVPCLMTTPPLYSEQPSQWGPPQFAWAFLHFYIYCAWVLN